MYTLTTIFHLASLIVFLVMFWIVLSQVSILRFNRRLWKSIAIGPAAAVWVDWPQSFMKKLCSIWQVEFVASSGKRAKPARINPKPIIDLFVFHGISKIRYDEREGMIIWVRHLPDQLADTESRLTESFGSNIVVKLEQG